jgi:hypothetical protein
VDDADLLAIQDAVIVIKRPGRSSASTVKRTAPSSLREAKPTSIGGREGVGTETPAR